jgi:hypothetical protein
MISIEESDRLYEEMEANKDELESRDLECNGGDFAEALAAAVNADGGEPSGEFKEMTRLQQGAPLPGGGEVLKSIKGMGTVYDWRPTNWTKANGGTIVPSFGVQHIPVVRNVDGFADIVTLRNVLVDQGLMIQQCTDREGNVGLFVYGNHLCFQARGANQCSWGTEHMHMTTSESWTKRQLRAAAWVNQLNNKHYGTPLSRGTVGSGNGLVRVIHPGQTTHQRISQAAGFNDRSDPGVKGEDPGGGYDFEYVSHCEQFFAKNGHFEGA